MKTTARIGIFLRLELADALRSRWVAFTGAVYGALLLMFVWLGLRESTVLGFTGLSRVVLNLASVVVLVVPLVALVATSQAVVGARSRGFFELMLAQPCRRDDWLLAAAGARLAVVLGPLLVLLGALPLLGAGLGGEAGLGPLVLRSVALIGALVWAFVGLGFLLSSWARSPERATVYALLAWLVASALHDFALIGLLLQARIAPGVVFALAAANPVEASRIALLGAVDPELSVLGPVGFWLANTLGPRLTFAVGVGWPLVLGGACFVLARRSLARSDLVG